MMDHSQIRINVLLSHCFPMVATRKEKRRLKHAPIQLYLYARITNNKQTSPTTMSPSATINNPKNCCSALSLPFCPLSFNSHNSSSSNNKASDGDDDDSLLTLTQREVERRVGRRERGHSIKFSLLQAISDRERGVDVGALSHRWMHTPFSTWGWVGVQTG